MTSTDLGTRLPNAYDAGDRVRQLLRSWNVNIDLGAFKSPRQVINGLDYGGIDFDSRGCTVAFHRVAGEPVPVRTVSVRSFDANGLGSWTAKEAQHLKAGDLVILNSAAGNNVKSGTENNTREQFFGAKLKSGAIVVGTMSDELPNYLNAEGTIMVELPLWPSGSQARGRDVFQTIGYAFYQEASRDGWNGGEHRLIGRDEVPFKQPDPAPTQIVFDESPRQYVDGVPTYHVWEGPALTHSPSLSFIPTPPNNPRAAGYRASQLTNGGQVQRSATDPKNVPALVVIDPPVANGSRPVRLWAQIQGDGSLVVAPAQPEVWQLSRADNPIFDTGVMASREQIGQRARELFNARDRLKVVVDRNAHPGIALPDGIVPIDPDPFGNFNIARTGEELKEGQVVTVSNASGTHKFPVRPTLFNAKAAESRDQLSDPACAGASMRASGGGYPIAVQLDNGEVVVRTLQVSQLYVRTNNSEIQSGAAKLGVEKNAHGVFDNTQDLSIGVGPALDRSSTPVFSAGL